MEIPTIQKHLKKEGMDGWLIYFFQDINMLGRSLLELPENIHQTRRAFYWIPAKGEPAKIVHRIESDLLSTLEGETHTYFDISELKKVLEHRMQHARMIAMEYSPRCDLPYISKVDAGTVELVESCGPSVVSSANLLQPMTACLSREEIDSHGKAARHLEEALQSALHALQTVTMTEYDFQQHLIAEIEKRGCTYGDHGPICARNEHSALPHFSPSSENQEKIQSGDLLLLDQWCKTKEPHSVYVDITRMAFVGDQIPNEIQNVFEIVRNAQKSALRLIQNSYAEGKSVSGADVDRLCRKIISDAGYGEYFIHRTGHSITQELHGPGAHLDSVETLDERPLIPNTLFSIEPGIYLPGKFGIRLEVDVFITAEGDVIPTTVLQEEIWKLCVK